MALEWIGADNAELAALEPECPELLRLAEDESDTTCWAIKIVHAGDEGVILIADDPRELLELALRLVQLADGLIWLHKT